MEKKPDGLELECVRAMVARVCASAYDFPRPTSRVELIARYKSETLKIAYELRLDAEALRARPPTQIYSTETYYLPKSVRRYVRQALKWIAGRTSRQVSLAPPQVGEWMVAMFTPSKFRETAMAELAEGFHYNLARFGRRSAVFAYWWEIGRNTTAFIGWKRAAIASALGAAALGAKAWLGI